jgi:hypothetical protein
MQGLSAFSFWRSSVFRIKSELWSDLANPHQGMVAQVFNRCEKRKREKMMVAQASRLCSTGWEPVPPNSKNIGATRRVAFFGVTVLYNF